MAQQFYYSPRKLTENFLVGSDIDNKQAKWSGGSRTFDSPSWRTNMYHQSGPLGQLNRKAPSHRPPPLTREVAVPTSQNPRSLKVEAPNKAHLEPTRQMEGEKPVYEWLNFRWPDWVFWRLEPMIAGLDSLHALPPSEWQTADIFSKISESFGRYGDTAPYCSIVTSFAKKFSEHPHPNVFFFLVACHWLARKKGYRPERQPLDTLLRRLIRSFLETKNCWDDLGLFCDRSPNQLLTVMSCIGRAPDQLSFESGLVIVDCFLFFFTFAHPDLLGRHKKSCLESLHKIWRRSLEADIQKSYPTLVTTCVSYGLFHTLHDEGSNRTRLLRAIFFVNNPNHLPENLLECVDIQTWLKSSESAQQIQQTLEEFGPYLNTSIQRDGNYLVIILKEVVVALKKLNSWGRNKAWVWTELMSMSGNCNSFARLPELQQPPSQLIELFERDVVYPELLKDFLQSPSPRTMFQNMIMVTTAAALVDLHCPRDMMSGFPVAFEAFNNGTASMQASLMCVPFILRKIAKKYPRGIETINASALSFLLHHLPSRVNDQQPKTNVEKEAKVLVDKTKALLHFVVKERATLPEVKTFQEHRVFFKHFWEHQGGFEETLGRQQKEFEELFREMVMITNFLIFLRSFKVKTQIPPKGYENDDLKTLRSKVQNYQQGLKTQSGDELLKLRFLFTAKSVAFRVFSRRGFETESGLHAALRQTEHFYAVLCGKDDPPIHRFKEIFKDIVSIGTALEIEVKCACDYLNRFLGGGGKSGIDLAVNKLMTAASDFLLLCDSMPDFIHLLEQEGFLTDQQKLQLQQLTEQGDQTPMNSVPDKLASISRELSVTVNGAHFFLRPQQLRIFHYLSKVRSTIDFFRHYGPWFESHRDELTGLLQGNSPGLSLLNNVISVLRLLTPFQIKPPSFGGLIEHFFRELPNDLSELERRGKMLLIVHEEVDQVRSWTRMGHNLNTIYTLIPYIKRLLGHAQYRSRLVLHSSGQRLWLVDKSGGGEAALPDTNLHDILRALRVFNTRVDKVADNPEQKIVHQFLMAYEFACNLHAVRLELEKDGHPDFQGADEDLNSLGKLGDVEEWEEVIDNTRAEQVAWQVKIKEAVEAQPRLLFLPRAALCQFNQVVGTMELAVSADEVHLRCMPFIFLCFPDAFAQGLESRFTTRIITETWREANSKMPVNQNEHQGKEHHRVYSGLLFICRFLQCLADKINLCDDFSRNEKFCCEMLPKIIRAHKYSPENVYHYLFENSKGIKLHPSQILECRRSTPEQEINRFTAQCNAFPSLPYYLLYVNKLGTGAREALLKTISMTAQRRSILLSNFHLVFTENHNEVCFSFLTTTFATPVATLPPLDISSLRRKEFVQLELVTPLQALVTRAGKSTWIQHQIRSLFNKQGVSPVKLISVTVNEEFQPHSFLESLRTAVRHTLAIHFTVSPYAALESLNRFILNMVVHGFVFDEHTGEGLHLSSLGSKVSLFFELSAGPQGDNKCKTGTIENFLAQLPAVKICSGNLFQGEAAKLTANWMSGFLTCPLGHLSARFLSWSMLSTSGRQKQLITLHDSSIHAKQPELDQLKKFLESHPMMQGWRHDYAIIDDFLKIHGRRCKNLVHHIVLHSEGSQAELAKFVAESLDRFALDSIRLAHPILLLKTPHLWTSCDQPEELTSYEINLLETAGPNTVNVTQQMFQTELGRERAYSLIAHGLGLARRPDFLLDIINHEQYIPTPDLMLTLLTLHERRQSGLNVVFRGGTGRGKTKLLSLYSMIANAKSELLCPVLHEVHNHILRHLIEVRPGAFRSRTLSLFGKIQNGVIVHHPINFPKTVQGVLRFIDFICKPGLLQDNLGEALKNVPINIPEDPVGGLYPLVAKTILVFLLKFFSEPRTSLIKKTPSIKHLLSRKRLDYEPDELTSLVRDVLYCEYENLFEVMLMHQNISAEEFRQKVGDLEVKADLLVKADSSLVLVVFIDEINTTGVMGLVKEVYCDRKLDGKAIAQNIFFVAAINPLLSASDGARSEFVVRPLPPSMGRLVVDFPDMTGAQEEHIIRQVFPDDDFMQQLVQLGQHYVRNAKIARVHVSIRDILRAKELYQYFSTTDAGEALLGSKVDDDGKISKRLPLFERPQRAMMMTMALGYYFRLPALHRNQLAEEIQKAFNAPPRRWNSVLKFGEVCQSTLRSLYDNAKIPLAVAPTPNLLENLFAIVVATDLKIPLVIVGPPGCSKTLSFTIALDNMSSTTQAKKPLFHLLGSMQPFRYQCSDASTDTEIEATYRSAIQRQEVYDGDHPKRCRTRCTVLLDEAGIPDENKMPLKIIHYFTDTNNFFQTSVKLKTRDVRVGTIMLSNCVLDAAKMSRCMQVFHSNDALQQDLPVLCWGILNNGPYMKGAVDQVSETVVNGLCEAYKDRNSVITAESYKDLFHLRDFVYFLRLLRHLCVVGEYERFEFSKDHLVHALQRHFGGVSAGEFKNLVQLFVQKIGEPYFAQLRSDPSQGGQGTIEELIAKRTVLNLIAESQSEVLTSSNINNSSFRHVMLIDSTDTEAAISILFSSGVCSVEDTYVVRLGDFEQDHTEAARADAVMRVKVAMEDGKSVVLINGDAIFGSFYDVFNKHFNVQIDVYFEEGDVMQVPKTRERLTSHVAVGSYSRPCEVHPNFRLIVHMPLSKLNSAPRPLLNRFEKQLISLELIITRMLSNADLHTQQLCNLVLSGMDDFVDQVHSSQSSRLFYGLVPRETVRSIFMAALTPLAKRDNSGVFSNLGLPFSFRRLQQKYFALEPGENIMALRDTDPGFVEGNHEIAQVLKIIRLLNFKLLQIARPESFFVSQKFDELYTTEYMQYQEHLSVVRFLDSIYQAQTNLKAFQDSDPASFWCIFTRSSPELHLLHKGVTTESLLCALKHLADSHAWTQQSPPLDNETCQVLSLDSVSSGADCEVLFKDFFQGDAMMLIVVVNLATSRSAQINLCRDLIRTHKRSGKLIFMLMHSPPEMNALNYYSFHSIWGDDWDLCYIDSLGVDSTRESIPEIDIRSWISLAYGVQSPVDVRSIAKAFAPMFQDCLQEVIENTWIPKNPLLLNPATSALVKGKLESDPSLAKFYDNSASATRFPVIQEVFKTFHNFEGHLLESFGRRWSHQRGLLHKLFGHTCRQILKGEVVVSLVKVVSRALRFMLAALVREAVQASVFYYGLYPLKDPSVVSMPWSVDLARIFAAVLELPSSANLFNLDTGAPLFCPQETNPNTTFPFFHYIEERLQNFANQAARLHPGNQHTKYLEMVKESDWNVVIEYIEKDFRCASAFLQDWVTRVLYRVHISPKFFPVFGALQRLLCRLYDPSMDETHLVRNLPILKKKYRRLNSFMYFCLEPLVKLKPEEKDLQSFVQAIESFPLGTQDFDDSLIATLVSKCCMMLQEKLKVVVVGEDGHEMLLSWISVFALFRGRFQSRIVFERLLKNLDQTLQQQALSAYDIMSTVFFVSVNSQLPPMRLWVMLQKLELRSWFGQGNTVFKSWINCMNFLVRVAAQQEDSESERAAMMTRDLLHYGLNDPREASSVGSESEADVESIFDIVELLLNCLLQPEQVQEQIQAIVHLLRTQISFSWLCTTFSQLVMFHSSSWIEKFLDCLFSFLFARLPLAEISSYTFEPVLMPSACRGDKSDIIPVSPPKPLQLLQHLIFYTIRSAPTWAEEQTLQRAVEKYECNRVDLSRKDPPERKVQLTMFRAVLATSVLDLAAASLNCSVDPVIQAQQWSPQTKTLLQELLSGKSGSGAPQHSAYYFFHLLENKPDFDVASKIMVSPVVQTVLLRPEWAIVHQAESFPHYHFQFMFDETFPVFGLLYKEFSQSVLEGRKEKLNQFVALPRCKYPARMFCVLVAYYHFYNSCRSCSLLRELIQTPSWRRYLEINDGELKAFLFLCSGPQNATSEKTDPLLWNFSLNSRQGQNQPSVVAHLMVNFLAVCLGSPPNTTHFYEPMFHPGKIDTKDISNSGKSFAPGSTFQHNYWDCGYQTYVVKDQPLPPAANVLGNHLQYRLTMNMMVWGAIAWCLLLDKTNEAQLRKNYHLLNAMSDISRRSWRFSSPQRCSTYVFERAAGFFALLDTEREFHDRRMSAGLFVTQSLFYLWQETNKPKPDPALRDHFSTEAEAINYETYLRKAAFERAFEENLHLQTLYQKKNLSGRGLDLQLLRQSRSHVMASPVVSTQQFEMLLVDEHSDQKAFMVEFLKKIYTLPRPMRQIPNLILVKDLLGEVFYTRITAKEADDSYLNCLRLVEDREPQLAPQVQLLRKLLTHLTENWHDIASALNINVCGAARRAGRMFEAQIPALNPDTRLCVLLKSDEGSSLIDTVLDELLHQHNNMLQTDVKAMGFLDPLSLFSAPPTNIDQQTLLANPAETAYLTMGKTNPMEFVGTLSTQVKQSCLAATPDDIHKFLFLPRTAGLHFEHVVHLALLHLRLMTTVTIAQSQPKFQFMSPVEEELIKNEDVDLRFDEQIKAALMSEEGLGHRGAIEACLRLVRQLQLPGLVPIPEEELSLLRHSLHDPTRQGLEELANLCRRVMQLILTQGFGTVLEVGQGKDEKREEEDSAQISLERFIGLHLPDVRLPGLFVTVRHFPVTGIKSLAKFVCEEYLEDNAVFHDKFRIFKTSLSDAAKIKLQELEHYITKNETSLEEVKIFHETITKVLVLIQGPTIEPLLQNDISLVKLFQQLVPESRKLWGYIHPEVLVCNLVSFLRSIHWIARVAQAVIQSASEKTVCSATYRERVSSELVDQIPITIIEVSKPVLPQEMYTKWTYLSAEDVEGEVEPERAPLGTMARGLRGLLNPSKLSYLNSLVQAISALPSLREAVLRLTENSLGQVPIPNIVRELGALLRKLWYADSTQPLLASSLLSALNGSDQFSWTRSQGEQDVAELLNGLLTVCGSLVVPGINRELSTWFRFDTTCHQRKDKNSASSKSHTVLPLHMPQSPSSAPTLQHLIDTCFVPNQQSGEDTVMSPPTESPPVLMLSVTSRDVSNIGVMMDKEVVLGHSKYYVMSIVLQPDSGPNGHYITYSRLHAQWWLFDDSSVTSVPDDALKKTLNGICVVFCQRVDIGGAKVWRNERDREDRYEDSDTEENNPGGEHLASQNALVKVVFYNQDALETKKSLDPKSCYSAVLEQYNGEDPPCLTAEFKDSKVAMIYDLNRCLGDAVMVRVYPNFITGEAVCLNSSTSHGVLLEPALPVSDCLENLAQELNVEICQISLWTTESARIPVDMMAKPLCELFPEMRILFKTTELRVRVAIHPLGIEQSMVERWSQQRTYREVVTAVLKDVQEYPTDLNMLCIVLHDAGSRYLLVSDVDGKWPTDCRAVHVYPKQTQCAVEMVSEPSQKMTLLVDVCMSAEDLLSEFAKRINRSSHQIQLLTENNSPLSRESLRLSVCTVFPTLAVKCKIIADKPIVCLGKQNINVNCDAGISIGTLRQRIREALGNVQIVITVMTLTGELGVLPHGLDSFSAEPLFGQGRTINYSVQESPGLPFGELPQRVAVLRDLTEVVFIGWQEGSTLFAIPVQQTEQLEAVVKELTVALGGEEKKVATFKEKQQSTLVPKKFLGQPISVIRTLLQRKFQFEQK